MGRRLAKMMVALALLGAGMLACASPGAPPDVRILIDVSGSMKRSDPDNLRRSALALVVRLLPEGARAGVWTFGQYTNMQVRLGEVTPEWRAEAEAGARAVHSRGLFTNIEDAIARSTWDWTRPAPGAHRHVILLTDGVVDVSKDPAESAASRQRLIDEQLQRLARAGVRVHTIALSDEVDLALLRMLAAETDGAHVTARSAEALQRAFLHMFERTAPVDALPLEDNAFTVDETVDEMTLLVFARAGAPATRLLSPGGETIDATSRLDAITWRAEAGYDLVTVQSPAPGQWRIEAEVDPDNRVLIVTDLRLAWEPLPNNLSPADSLEIAALLTEHGEAVVREDFLSILDARLTHWAAGAEPAPIEVARAGGASRFSAALAGPLTAGPHELVLTVDGGTFSRQLRHVVDVVPPVSVEVRPAADIEQPTYLVEVVAAEGLVEPSSLVVRATLTGAAGTSREPASERREDGALVIATGTLTEPGQHRLALVVLGSSPAGRDVDVMLPDIELAGPEPVVAKPEPEPAPAEPEPAPAEPAPAAAEPALPTAPAAPEPPPEIEGLVAVDESDPPNWTLVGGLLAGFNLVVGLGVWLAVRWLRRRAASASGSLEEGAEPERLKGNPAASDGAPDDGAQPPVLDAA